MLSVITISVSIESTLLTRLALRSFLHKMPTRVVLNVAREAFSLLLYNAMYVILTRDFCANSSITDGGTHVGLVSFRPRVR